MTSTKTDVTELIEEYHPDFNWDRTKDIIRAVRWELYMGPQEDGYWTEVEPLEHYKWKSYLQAEEDLVVALDELPYSMYLCDDLYLALDEPDSDMNNWDVEEVEDEWVYVGPETYSEIIVPLELLGDAVYKQIYQ